MLLGANRRISRHRCHNLFSTGFNHGLDLFERQVALAGEADALAFHGLNQNFRHPDDRRGVEFAVYGFGIDQRLEHRGAIQRALQQLMNLAGAKAEEVSGRRDIGFGFGFGKQGIPLGERLVDVIKIHKLRLEPFATHPFAHCHMLRVSGIFHGFQKVVESGQATDILWRALAHGFYAAGQRLTLIAGQDLFKPYLVLPAVAEIIVIRQSLPFLAEHSRHCHHGFILKIQHAIEILRRITNQPVITRLKHMQMTGLPAHRQLDNPVKILKRGIRRNQQPAPDRRPGAEK